MDNVYHHLERDKKVAIYERDESVIDVATGEILSQTKKIVNKVSAEPEYVKLYYKTILAFHDIENLPLTFIMSLSKFMDWSNEGSPLCVTINKRAKDIISQDCNVTTSQVARYMKIAIDNGILFRTEYRGVYEVNPFVIAKGKWDSIRKLRVSFDFIGGQWERKITYDSNEEN